MKKLFIALLVAQSFVQFADAQERYFTREGSVSFFSATPVENIEADNKKLQSVIDMSSGGFEFAALIKSFEFEKALMEEHFNENYMESNTYPKATFRGKIENLEELKSKGFPSSATAMAKGVMTIHGVDQEVEIPAHLVKVSNGYNVTCKFNVKPQDYEIEIPNAVQDKIAKEIEVTVDAVLNPMK